MEIGVVPESLQEAWGEAVTRDMVAWLQTMWKTAVQRDEWHEVTTRLSLVEQAVADVKVEAREFRREVGQRFDGLDRRLDGMNLRLERQAAGVNERLERQAAELTGRLDGMNERLERQAGELTGRLDGMNERLERQAAELNGRFDELGARIERQTRWAIGLLALYAALLGTMLMLDRLAVLPGH
ncbi:MAG: hypothetical protein ACE5EL_06185 [Anaerolineae bacterium]